MAARNRYDAFISYRHGDPDEAFARTLLADLEGAGLKLAIDERDFAPAQHPAALPICRQLGCRRRGSRD